MAAARRWLPLLVLCFAVLLLVTGVFLQSSSIRSLFSSDSILQAISQNWKNSSVARMNHMPAPMSTPLRPTLHFLPPDERKRILFVSYPGSGNTWVRHLIEIGTRVYTGSVYSDPALFKDFYAENVSDTSVIAIKDHNPCDNCLTYSKSMSDDEKKVFRSIPVCEFCDQIRFTHSEKTYNRSNPDRPGFILHLIRNPFPAIIAYYQYWFVPLSSAFLFYNGLTKI